MGTKQVTIYECDNEQCNEEALAKDAGRWLWFAGDIEFVTNEEVLVNASTEPLIFCKPKCIYEYVETRRVEPQRKSSEL